MKNIIFIILTNENGGNPTKYGSTLSVLFQGKFDTASLVSKTTSYKADQKRGEMTEHLKFPVVTTETYRQWPTA